MTISKKIFKGSVPSRVKFEYFINVLLFICFIFIILSGILISKTILTFISSKSAFWKLGHFFAASLAIVLCGIHLGLHWNVLKGTLFKYLKTNKVLKYLSIALLTVTVVYGGYNIVKSNFASWITIPIKVLSQNQESEGKHNGRKPSKKDSAESIPLTQIVKEDSIKVFKTVTTYGSITITFAAFTSLVELKLLNRQ